MKLSNYDKYIAAYELNLSRLTKEEIKNKVYQLDNIIERSNKEKQELLNEYWKRYNLDDVFVRERN